VKWLSILALLVVALPAHETLSLKDWEKKSQADRADDLGSCVISLIVEIAKTDRPLAMKIKEWYSVKSPGKEYTEGTYTVYARIKQLEQQERDGTADLSKIQVEDIVYSVTAEKFKLPPREIPQELGDFKDAAPAAHTAPASTAIMVGKIDVSHFAGLKPGDTPAQVASVYGEAVTDYGFQKWYGASHLIVDYADGVVKRVEVSTSALDMARSHAGNDALLDLFGHTEEEVIALLGPPIVREQIDAPTYYLYWPFAMSGHAAGKYANTAAGSERTLEIDFRPGSGCFLIKLKW
jgi:hypothetical protein